MVYQYVAYNENGEIVKGRLAATTEEAATDLLGYAGYRAISLKAYVPLFNLEKLSAGFFRVRPTEVILFYRQLAMLLESGIDIVSSLELLQAQSTNGALKKVLGKVVAELRGGSPLSRALSQYPNVFAPIYCRLLTVGEQSGELETVLKQSADDMEKEIATSQETQNALMYPVITTIVTVIVVGVLVTFVLPSFARLYSALGVNLPLPAQMLITLAGKVQVYWRYFLLAVLIMATLVYLYFKTPGGRYWRDKLVLRLPVLGRISHLSELARYCRNMSLLFRAGLPLTEVMPLVVQTSHNCVMARALTDVQQAMVKGEGLSQPMAKNKFFLPMMVQMVRVGEETGNLETTLLAVAKSYEAETEDRTRRLIALIQPTMTLIIGLVIGLIALSLTSAMYSMYGQGF